MKYTKDQSLDIGRRIYEGEISRFEAATEYGIGSNTAREYMRLYRAEHHLPVRHVEINAEKIKEPPRPPARLEDYEAMSKEELIQELVRAIIVEARLKKRIRSEGSWCSEGVCSFRQQEYQVILELSSMFPVKLLCEMMGIQRSSFYNWKAHLSKPSKREKALVAAIMLFKDYHLKYPSHGYRWLNAKIYLDTGKKMSDPYAHKYCKAIGIKSHAKHYRYKKPGNPYRVFPNLLMTEMAISGPLQCIVSDMTAFHVRGSYYELTLYMDLWNNEIVSHSLSARRGDRMTFISGLTDLLELKKEFPDMQMILHSDQGSVYASKDFNELLPMYNVVRSISRAGTPTDNAAMEAINGWIKAELFMDFHVTGNTSIEQEVDDYIVFFNE